MATLTQAQNEALVKLLLVARYQDKKLSLMEEEAFKQTLNQLQWAAVIQPETFVSREITAVRKALDNEQSLQDYLATQASVFDSAQAKATCLQLLEKIIDADGVEAAENQYLQQVKASLQA